MVEGYVSVMIITPEPKYTTGRILLAILFYLFAFVDDLFDAYGTIAELQLITNAISRSRSSFCFVVRARFPHIKLGKGIEYYGVVYLFLLIGVFG